MINKKNVPIWSTSGPQVVNEVNKTEFPEMIQH